MPNERQDFPVPPVPLPEAPEEPLRMLPGPGPAALHLENQPGYLLAVQVVEEGGPEGVLARVDHDPSVACRG